MDPFFSASTNLNLEIIRANNQIQDKSLLESSLDPSCLHNYSPAEVSSIIRSNEVAKSCHNQMVQARQILDLKMRQIKQETAVLAKYRHEKDELTLKVQEQSLFNHIEHENNKTKIIEEIKLINQESAENLKTHISEMKKRIKISDATIKSETINLEINSKEVENLKATLANLK